MLEGILWIIQFVCIFSFKTIFFFFQNVMYKKAKSWASLVEVRTVGLESSLLSLLLAPWFSWDTRSPRSSFILQTWKLRPRWKTLPWPRLSIWGRHGQAQNPRLLSPGPWPLLVSHCVGHPDLLFLLDELGPRTTSMLRSVAAFTVSNTTVWQDTYVSISYIKQIS